ncbi:6-phosphofructokinase [candidate division KD3-62 bacterium DG_56]|uniref:ATP-dependent 6-phosphofructokinase n=1 Tax=candidate division KD3-62 bacterium DG_56 TaxID=1704032 RepID=A0A0S7XNM2_9BACT|nr:MAG: 6-phosphofructokinase [candidate division KD3-62 bacterium DG_56]
MRNIAVLTSGGDAPGMNPCIRSVVRSALTAGVKCYGVRRGYAGLVNGDFEELTSRSVGGILRRGGTFLQTARSERFKTEPGFHRAVETLKSRGIDGMVVIGGDGSLRGARELHRAAIPVIGVPATIDNDLAVTDTAIGVDTALNTALDAVDKVKDTASSHHRACVIEVMGRNCGYLALMTGVAGGAEMVVLPEFPCPPQRIAEEIESAQQRGKPHFIAIVAEGATPNGQGVLQEVRQAGAAAGFDARLVVLGHVQRGGSPSAFDRILATRMGAAAFESLQAGRSGEIVALVGANLQPVTLDEVLGKRRELDPDLYQLADVLAQ